MNMTRYIIFITLFFPLLTLGQNTLTGNDINFIEYGKNQLSYYTIKNDSIFEIHLNTEDSERGFVKLSIDKEYQPINNNELLKNENIIKIKDIRKTDFDKTFNHSKYEIIENSNKIIISRFNKFFIMAEYYLYKESYDVKSEKHVLGWVLNNVIFYNTYYVDFVEGKKIVVIDNRNGYIIPTKDKLIVKIDDKDLSNSKLVEYNDEDLSRKLIYFYFKNNYFINNEPNNKWSINSKYGEKVIPTIFDTIYYNNSFIIGMQNNRCYVYNTRLDELSNENTRAAYPLSQFRIQFLQGNELKVVDVLNQNAESKKEINLVCGTVDYYTYKVTKDTLFVNIDKRITEGIELFNKYSLSSLDVDSVYFLNKLNKLSYDDNSSALYFDEKHMFSYRWLIVSKNNKFGIIEFNVSNDVIEFKKILPIEYDSIEGLGYNHPIKLKINGLFSYFQVNDFKYKNLEPFINYFCRYTKEDSQKGWLDLKGNEYPDK